MSRITAILSGGDWTDASVEHLVLPERPYKMEIGREKELYDIWYRDVYCPTYAAGEQPDFKTFTEWLVERGARTTTDEELEEFWE